MTKALNWEAANRRDRARGRTAPINAPDEDALSKAGAFLAALQRLEFIEEPDEDIARVNALIRKSPKQFTKGQRK